MKNLVINLVIALLGLALLIFTVVSIGSIMDATDSSKANGMPIVGLYALAGAGAVILAYGAIKTVVIIRRKSPTVEQKSNIEL